QQYGPERRGEGVRQYRDLVRQLARSMELADVGDEVARPAAADAGVVADHRPAADRALGRAAAEPVLAAGARGARLEAALHARQHRVHDHALADAPPLDPGPDLGDPTHVLVPEGERERAKRLERERVVRRDR